MFLRSLTLKGFKSFAESTTLEFEPGLNVVVGPNGSGKSNIVDAVAWVLGAQGPRAVRSARMDDVIFAGTGRKAALGRAEVSLTIDNSAGLLNIDLSEVTLTRTLFRTSGESEYALNGVACRLLDVQELLSDTGVGRQQHVIVSQGNLDAVLDARPEDRRLIVEEAAGILKFRRRKEKAERRLQGTEANLVRLSDLLREVGRQIRPLERQADAARRHGSLVDELGALQLYLRGRELAVLGARAEATSTRRDTLMAEEVRVRGELEGLDDMVARSESALAAAGRTGLVDNVGRLEALRERARGLAAVLAERRRSAERDLASTTDAGLVATMQADCVALQQELADVDREATLVDTRSAELGVEETALMADRAAQPAAEPLLARAAEARGELAARRASLERATADLVRISERSAGTDARLTAATVELRSSAADTSDATERQTQAESIAQLARAERTRAAEHLAATEAATRQASEEHRRWVARAEALAEAVGGADERPAAVWKAGSGGVVGMLIDLVEVDSGMEAAVEAAILGAVDTLVVEDATAARNLLASTGSEDLPTCVLALASAPQRTAPAAPVGTWRMVRQVVRSPHPGVDAALDWLLASTIVTEEWPEAVDAVQAQPGLTAVTLAGDRFSARGWRLGAGRAGAIRAALAEARACAAQTLLVSAEAQVAMASAAAASATAEAKAEEADRDLLVVGARRAEIEAACRQLHSEVARFESDVAQATAEMDRAKIGLDEDKARVTELESMLPTLESDEAESALVAATFAAAALRLQERADELASRRAEVDVRKAEIDERRRQLARRLEQVEARLSACASAEEASDSRRARGEGVLLYTNLLAGHLNGRLEEIDGHLGQMRARRDRHAAAVARESQRLEQLRGRRHGEERRLEEVRERCRRTELEEAEARMRLEAAVESLRRELDAEPEAAMAVPSPAIAAGSSPTSRARELERELRLIGQVNPLALEELAALQERHAFLTSQLDDVKSSRRELAKVIRAVEAEMSELLAAAYADVEEHFARIFETLFPGGRGRLTLTDPEHLLESGIEVDARPAGKNVRKLSLLSGGERSLVALAFLFAVFRSRPSPFYLLDEVEAALDDVNLHRFIDLLDEFRNEAQLLVVTHQKRTMEAADCLYGVTMQPGGSSRVLSERVATSV